MVRPASKKEEREGTPRLSSSRNLEKEWCRGGGGKRGGGDAYLKGGKLRETLSLIKEKPAACSSKK